MATMAVLVPDGFHHEVIFVPVPFPKCTPICEKTGCSMVPYVDSTTIRLRFRTIISPLCWSRQALVAHDLAFDLVPWVKASSEAPS